MNREVQYTEFFDGQRPKVEGAEHVDEVCLQLFTRLGWKVDTSKFKWQADCYNDKPPHNLYAKVYTAPLFVFRQAMEVPSDV